MNINSVPECAADLSIAAGPKRLTAMWAHQHQSDGQSGSRCTQGIRCAEPS